MKNRTFTTKNVPPVERRYGEQVEGATGEAQEIESTGIAELKNYNYLDNVTGKSHII